MPEAPKAPGEAERRQRRGQRGQGRACAGQLNAPKPGCVPWVSPLTVTAPAPHIAANASNGTQRG